MYEFVTGLLGNLAALSWQELANLGLYLVAGAATAWGVSRRVLGWVMPRQSPLLAAALEALDKPVSFVEQGGDEVLKCVNVYVKVGKSIVAGQPASRAAREVTVAASQGQDLVAALTSRERRIFSRKVRQVIDGIKRDRVAGQRATAAEALRGQPLGPGAFTAVASYNVNAATADEECKQSSPTALLNELAEAAGLPQQGGSWSKEQMDRTHLPAPKKNAKSA